MLNMKLKRIVAIVMLCISIFMPILSLAGDPGFPSTISGEGEKHNDGCKKKQMVKYMKATKINSNIRDCSDTCHINGIWSQKYRCSCGASFTLKLAEQEEHTYSGYPNKPEKIIRHQTDGSYRRFPVDGCRSRFDSHYEYYKRYHDLYIFSCSKCGHKYKEFRNLSYEDLTHQKPTNAKIYD